MRSRRREGIGSLPHPLFASATQVIDSNLAPFLIGDKKQGTELIFDHYRLRCRTGD